jgi:hypothetical protein
LNDALHETFVPGFFEYWYKLEDNETNEHSWWLLRFYERVEFGALIASRDAGVERRWAGSPRAVAPPGSH